jgi:protein-L-isoaspartate(D-aspartate) O-methyltransferase
MNLLKKIIYLSCQLLRYIFIQSCIIVILILSCSSRQKNIPSSQNYQEPWWKPKAEQMVISQIISRGVTDNRVIEVMKNTPRHLFVPEDAIDYAYNDYPLPIGYGQTISQPYIVALMTELLNLKGDEKVLEIGTGSGYQAAILSQLADSCFSIEVVRELAELSANRLRNLGYNNVVIKWGDGYQGWPDHAPFDAIIITAAPEKIPEELVNQLKTGGKMVVPVGTLYQNLLVIIKTNKGYQQRDIIPVRFVPMVHPDEPIPETKKEN